MNIPCRTPPTVCAPCTDADAALLCNASVETPDVRMFFANQFALRSSRFCEAVTQVAADLCALNPPEHFDSDVIFSSSEQTCIVDCSGSPVSYTVPSGAALGFTQAQADAAAYALACTFAAIVCAGGTPDPVPNEAQACSVVCQDGSVVTFTVPAGAVLGASLSEANATAYATACQAAALQCPDVPPPPLFGNSMVSSVSLCPATSGSGGSFTYVVPANTFFAASLAEANATAQSYADQQAVLDRSCLSNITANNCVGSSYSSVITTPLPGTLTWSLVSGALPPGLSFSNGIISGTSLAVGTYSFTIGAQSSNGNSTQRTYSICVFQITNASALPNGDPAVAYSVTFTMGPICANGDDPPPSGSLKWKVTAGSLPPGLSLDAVSGVLSGTPTTNGNYAFTISNVYACPKAFTLSVVENPMEWWKLVNLTGSVNGYVLTSSSVIFGVAGKYGTGIGLNSTGGGGADGEVFNAVPITGMAHTGHGIDAFVWLKTPAGVNGHVILSLDFADAAGVTVWSMSFDFHVTVGITYTLTPGGTSGNTVLAGSSAYRLFELWYDPVTKFIGIRINDGAVLDISSSPIGTAQPSTDKGSLSLSYNRITAGIGEVDACELTVYPSILTAPQRAAIYNAGAGVSWPVVLP